MSSKKQDSLCKLIPRKAPSSKAQPVIVVLEDNDGNDDTATGNCILALSFRDKPKLNGLVFKPAAMTSAPLRTLTIGRAKMDAGEEVTDADATAFLQNCCIYQKQTFSCHRDNIAFCGRSCCCNCCCNCMLHTGCNNHTECWTLSTCS